jgi:hypothetical protein
MVSRTLAAPDPAAWTAATFKSPADYTLTLTEAERQHLLETMHAIAHRGRLVPTTQLTRADFPGRALELRLRQAFEQVRSGYGFVVIRGLPRRNLTLDQFAAIVWGVNTYFGLPLSQNAEGELLSEVVDASEVDSAPRMYRSSLELRFHTNVTAMLSLACWNAAKSGGASALCSGVTVHNEIALQAPRLLESLYRGFHYHRLGEEAPRQERVTPFRIPVFAVREGQVSVRMARAGFIAGHYELGVPLSDLEIAAIDAFDASARAPGNAVTFALEPGDMVVINNYVVLHARTAFEDYAQPERKRCLLRVWLDAQNLRAVPTEFNQMVTQNGIPYQAGRHCTYDFQKLFREVAPRLLGARAAMPAARRSPRGST